MYAPHGNLMYAPHGTQRNSSDTPFQNKRPFNKKNDRPVSILPSITKVYERVIHIQLTENLDKLFILFCVAFRKGFGCQYTLLNMALDRHECAAAVLMDLPKAFDSLLRSLLVAHSDLWTLLGQLTSWTAISVIASSSLY